MRTADEINELAFLAQEAIALGVTKYTDDKFLAGEVVTDEWLNDDGVNPYSYEPEPNGRHKEISGYEQGIMEALQENGYCIPTYEVSIDPDFLAYVLEQNEQ